MNFVSCLKYSFMVLKNSIYVDLDGGFCDHFLSTGITKAGAKVGCVFAMAILFDFRMGQHRVDDHQEDDSHIIKDFSHRQSRLAICIQFEILRGFGTNVGSLKFLKGPGQITFSKPHLSQNFRNPRTYPPKCRLRRRL